MSMKVIFGGTFNPVHHGHIQPLLNLQKNYGFGAIGLMPNSVSPFKTETPPVSDQHRLAMLELALTPYPSLYIETCELHHSATSYTANTIKQWRSEDPSQNIVFIIGEDSYMSLHLWFDFEYILEHVTIVVLPRANDIVQKNTNLDYSLSPLLSCSELSKASIFVAQTPLLPISSSHIRNAVNNGEDISELISPAVLNYIREHNLYRYN